MPVSVIVALAVIICLAHLLGRVFLSLRQPKLVGEILAGILIGPFVLGLADPNWSSYLLGGTADEAGKTTKQVLSFCYWLGMMLLMFIAGSEVRRVLGQENRKPTAWILGIGTPLPFFTALLLGTYLPLHLLAGPKGEGTPILLIVAIAVAVTSIPVISRIFYDLKILHTRFASLVLGAALLEDIALWGVLAVATAIGAASAETEGLVGGITAHVGYTIGYMVIGLFVAPTLLRFLHDARWNVVRASSPTGYAALIMLVYAAIAAQMDVNVVFAAFLAGFGLVGGMSGSQREKFTEPLEAIQKVGTGVFIPIYFVLIGARLNFDHTFSFSILLIFLFGSSLLCLCSIGLAARLAGFRGIEIVNLAVASNARGGPGIVLASVAYEAELINGAFFTTLVLTAVLTSQIAGVWLGTVVRRGWTLLREDAELIQNLRTAKSPNLAEEVKDESTAV